MVLPNEEKIAIMLLFCFFPGEKPSSNNSSSSDANQLATDHIQMLRSTFVRTPKRYSLALCCFLWCNRYHDGNDDGSDDNSINDDNGNSNSTDVVVETEQEK